MHRDLVEASPVQLLYRPGGKERPKDRTLSDTEIKALLANLVSPSANQEYQSLILFLRQSDGI